MNPSLTFDEDPGLEGPDYVALVIEWGDTDTTTPSAVAPEPRSGLTRNILTAVSALGAIVLATWGLRRLRAA